MRHHVVLLVLVAAAAAASVAPQPRAEAYPQPAVATRSWQLDFTHGDPQAIAIRSAEGPMRWYWYLPYKVVNNTDQEQLFLPEVTVFTDAGDIVPAGANVPASAFETIKKRLANPLLESPTTAPGRILIGEDSAKESVFIWPAFPHDVDEVKVFIGGLSGETQVIEHPVTREPVTMRKTLLLRYLQPGGMRIVDGQRLQHRGEEWVMR